MPFFSKAAGFWSATSLKKTHSKVFSVILSICDEHHSVRIAHIGYFHKTEGRLKYCLFVSCSFLKMNNNFWQSICVVKSIFTIVLQAKLNPQ